MPNIIRVDFKNKRVIEDYTLSSFMCSCCNAAYTFDSRYNKPEDKTKQIEMSVGKNNTIVRICEHCIEEMYSLLFDK